MSENCLCLSVSLVTFSNYPLQFYAKKCVCVYAQASARAFMWVRCLTSLLREMFWTFFSLLSLLSVFTESVSFHGFPV